MTSFNRILSAIAVLRGQAIIRGVSFRWEENDVLRVRSLDPTLPLLIQECHFDTNPEADNPTRILLGDSIGAH